MSGRPAADTIAARARPPFLNLNLACRNRDPETWYPDEGDTESATKARRICRRCPATTQCLTWALTTHQSYGIWGGKTVKERRYLLRTQHQPEETA